MTSKDEALKTAIEGYEECLENLQGWAAYASEYFQDKWDLEGEVKDHKDKINACKEALEQPAQDYVLICKKCGDELGIEYVPDEQPKMTYEQGFDHGYEAHRIEQENDKQQTIASIWEGISEIEQPAQEPVAWLKEYNEGGHGIYEVSYEGVYNAFPVYIHHTSQLMQKPYLWIEKDKGKNKNGDEFRITRIYHEYNENAIPLYTHPHQWQELTDDEITELHHNWITNSDTMYFARAIEQALRSKNAL